MAAIGHSSLAQVRVYIDEVGQEYMAELAMKKAGRQKENIEWLASTETGG